MELKERNKIVREINKTLEANFDGITTSYEDETYRCELQYRNCYVKRDSSYHYFCKGDLKTLSNVIFERKYSIYS